MTKTNTKRQISSHSIRNKTPRHSKAGSKTAREATRRMSGAPFRPGQPGLPQSKQAQIIAMLQAPTGATIDAMMHATGWLPHSVRGFLAGVIRKKLGLNLQSEASENGRVYRIIDHTASTVAAAKTSRAA